MAVCDKYQEDNVTFVPDRPHAPHAPPGADGSGAGWPDAYGRVIAQIGCPAYCCTPGGAILHCNPSAQRLWGGCPSPLDEGHWDGFARLSRPDGTPVEKSASPAALAARTGIAPPPTELVAESKDGQRRSLVIHARPVIQADGATVGVLCSLTDISERCRLEHEAREARDNRYVFLRMLAHELRNPLSPVMSVAAVLRQQPQAPDVVRMGCMVERQTRQLARLIGDLLDTSRIEQACDIPVAMRASSVGSVLELARDV